LLVADVLLVRNCRDDFGGGLLDVIERFAERVGVAVVEADVVGCGVASFQADGLANDECDGLGSEKGSGVLLLDSLALRGAQGRLKS